MKEDKRFYEGFEGEKKFIFCLYENDTPIEKLHLWEGYFDDILSLIPYSGKKWDGLAEYYQLALDFDDEHWKVPSCRKALEQLEAIDRHRMKYPRRSDCYDAVVELFRKAVSGKLDVYIDCE
ncbi:MAG: hypothetical protein J5926_05675 [Ruminococcus sp.]|nr:hypothetical protein [Ruminococcus sp.]